MSDISVFSYIGQDVRAVTIDGQPWFVLADIARILGLTNPTAAAGSVDADDLSTAEVIDSLGRTQTARITNESGMYSLVFQSRKPNAKEFKHWVTSVVLPEIRQTGSYVAEKETPEQFLARALTVAQGVLAGKDAQIERLAPRAEAWDAIASADGDYEVGDAAKILARAGIDTGRQRLFGQLAELGWAYRGPQWKWKARQRAVDAGYLAEKPQTHHHPRTGELVLDPPQVRVTVKGLERLRARLREGALEAVGS